MLSFFVPFGFLLPIASDAPIPAKVILDKMIASRTTAFATADIRWTLDATGYPRRYRRSRYDGKNWTYEETGDEDGVVHPGKVGLPGSCSEYRFLNADGLRWMVAENLAQASLWEAKVDVDGRLPRYVRANIDARILGIAPEATTKPLEAFLQTITRDLADDAFSTDDVGGGISTVTVKRPGITLKWWIDTKRGFNPVKIELRSDQQGSPLVSAAQVDLAYYDNHVWFPSRVTYTSVNNKNKLLSMSIYELHPEFDRPEHPAVLTPAHIGVEKYDTVQWQRPIGRPTECWDGKGFISMEEAIRQKGAGELLPTMYKATGEKSRRIANSDKGRWPKWYGEPSYGISKSTDIDEWEKYVRRFCLIRKCDERQRSSARGILDDCRRIAAPILSRIKVEQKKENDAIKREAMLAPIGDIFASQLVPRLDALLSTTQSQPTTQPSKLPPPAASSFEKR